jgi:hypothetical protein
MLSHTKAPYIKLTSYGKREGRLTAPGWPGPFGAWRAARPRCRTSRQVQGRPRLGALALGEADRVSACTEWPPLCELPPAVAPPTSAVSAVRTRLLENFFFSTASAPAAPLCTAGGTAVQSGFGSGSEATPAVQSA